MLCDIIFTIAITSSKKVLIAALGESQTKQFKEQSKRELDRIKKDAPSIKGSIYEANYQCCLCYIAWYKTLTSMKVSTDDAGKLIWQMNECLFRVVPAWLLKRLTKGFLRGKMKKSKQHQILSEANLVPEYDWKLRFRQIDANTFDIDIYECGMLKLGKRNDAMGMFPYLCRMDYLMAYYMGHGFVRNKTLADGDECCNCRFIIGGRCDWAPEKGFVERK
jgi:hypothetical protein